MVFVRKDELSHCDLICARGEAFGGHLYGMIEPQGLTVKSDTLEFRSARFQH
jgi:hypothetical protein